MPENENQHKKVLMTFFLFLALAAFFCYLVLLLERERESRCLSLGANLLRRRLLLLLRLSGARSDLPLQLPDGRVNQQVQTTKLFAVGSGRVGRGRWRGHVLTHRGRGREERARL